MPRKSKRKASSTAPPAQAPAQQDPAPSQQSKPPSLTSPEFMKLLQEHGGLYLTPIPEMQAARLGAGIISTPKSLKSDLFLIGLGTAAGIAGKGKRRTSAERTIRRNVEICDLRKLDAKKWTHGRLAKKYGMKKQSLARILKTEEKWRHLASQLPE